VLDRLRLEVNAGVQFLFLSDCDFSLGFIHFFLKESQHARSRPEHFVLICEVVTYFLLI
jgi:hypothetical protein